jgi:hypothetical protein
MNPNDRYLGVRKPAEQKIDPAAAQEKKSTAGSAQSNSAQASTAEADIAKEKRPTRQETGGPNKPTA